MPGPFTLYQNPGWGSVLIEAQLCTYGFETRLVAVGDIFQDTAVRAGFAKINPLIQIPTLGLPSGAVMTESAAITLYLADIARNDLLVPGPGASERAEFLRWLIYLVAAIYPTFVFGDMPERYVRDDPAYFQQRMIERRQELWQIIEAAAKDPWFLGQRYSAIDIYLACMVHWRPRQAWFAAHAPKIAAIAMRASVRPEIAACMTRNFG